MEKVIQSKIIKTDTLSDNESESENNSEYAINDIENKNIEDISKNSESLMEKVIQSKIIKNDNLSDNESKQENNYIYNAESGKIENVPENSKSLMEKVIQSKIIKDESFPVENVENTENPEEKQITDTADSEKKEKNITVIGEAFKNYIIAQADENIIIIDKHAAHERVLFEKLKRGVGKLDQQYLMIPSKMLFSNAEYEALQSNAEKLADLGFIFEFEEFPYATLKAVPMFLSELDADEIVTEIAHNLMSNKQNPQTHYFDDMLHTMACKAAIKANDDNLTEELQYLADEIFDDNSIRHCPHGRPVMFKISKYELEKQFKRIV
jgi:DNA mismatch repair protein MutL